MALWKAGYGVFESEKKARKGVVMAHYKGGVGDLVKDFIELSKPLPWWTSWEKKVLRRIDLDEIQKVLNEITLKWSEPKE